MKKRMTTQERLRAGKINVMTGRQARHALHEVNEGKPLEVAIELALNYERGRSSEMPNLP